MKSLYTILFSILLIALPTQAICQDILDGIYVGLEKTADLSPENMEEKWFHENILNVKDKAVDMRTLPVIMRNGEKIYSAADGGFYTYSGNIYSKDNKRYLRMKIVDCDYCVRPKSGTFPTKEYEIKIQSNISFIINDVEYTLRAFNMESDWHLVSPVEFIEILKNHAENPVPAMTVYPEPPADWIKKEDIDELIKMIYRKEASAHAVSALSSFIPFEKSTVGDEAIFMIKGFIEKNYPPYLYSGKGNAEEIEAWYQKEFLENQ